MLLNEIIVKCEGIDSMTIHPNYIEQKESLFNVYSLLTKEYVEEHIIIPLGYNIIDFHELKDGGGVINPIFILNVISINDSGNKEKWLLRVCNPHKYWINDKTKIEINTMKMISKYCPDIPIPKIIDDSYTNKMGNKCLFQYILFDFVDGYTLENVQKDLDIKQKHKVFEQLSSFVSSLQKIPSDDNQFKIGSCLDILVKDNDNIIQYGGLRQDGPSIGPFQDIISYFQHHFDWIIHSLLNHYYDNNGNGYKSHLYDLNTINRIKGGFNELISKYIKPLNEKHTISYNFNHCDLNASNIMIDNPKDCNIICIIDWESARFDAFNDDINTLNDYIKEYKLDDHVEMLKTNEISEKLNNLNWIKQYGCDMIFYTITWWGPLLFDKNQDNDQKLKDYIIQESKTGFNNLQKKFKEYNIII